MVTSDMDTAKAKANASKAMAALDDPTMDPHHIGVKYPDYISSTFVSIAVFLMGACMRGVCIR